MEIGAEVYHTLKSVIKKKYGQEIMGSLGSGTGYVGALIFSPPSKLWTWTRMDFVQLVSDFLLNLPRLLTLDLQPELVSYGQASE